MTAIKGVLSIIVFCLILGAIWSINYAVSIGVIHNGWSDEANSSGYEPVDTPWHTVPLQWINDNIGVKI